MTRSIAIANCKGGVGKTTTTVTLGSVLASRGKRVALIDLDSQQNLCLSLRVKPKTPGLADAIFTRAILDIGSLDEVLVDVDSLAVAGGYGLEHTENKLSYCGTGWELALRSLLETASDELDFILIDCSPAAGCLTTLGLAACDEVLIPVQTEYLAVKQVAGILNLADRVRNLHNHELRVLGFLPTMFDVRTKHSTEILMKISTEANRCRTRMFHPIPRTVRVAEATAEGRSVIDYAPDSIATAAFNTLADEIEGARAPYPIASHRLWDEWSRSAETWQEESSSRPRRAPPPIDAGMG